MANILNIIIGVRIIILNIIPFLIKKSEYIFLTGLISLLMLMLLFYF